MELLRLETTLFLVHLAQWFVPWSGFLCGCGVLITFNALHTEKSWLAEISGGAVLLTVVGFAFGAFLPTLTRALSADYVVSLSVWRFILWFVLFGCGLAATFSYYRLGAVKLDALRARFVKGTRQARDSRTDIRTVTDQLPKIGDYDPRAFYEPDHFFLGLDVHNAPVYWHGRMPHIAISGYSGAGKGRKLQDLAAQSIANDELLIYLDPKDDEWGAYAVYDACLHSEKPYYFVNLSPRQAPQFNLLDGAEDYEIEELFNAGFDLADKGGEGDFYRANDRAAAYEAAHLAATKRLTLAELWQEVGESFAKRAPGFLGKLHEAARVQPANAKTEGIDFAKMLETGGAIYVVGSTTLQPVRRMQQMLFMRLLQLATKRDRTHTPLRTVCIIADEAKYHISRPVLNGLGTARDKGVRVVVAFQSFADLRDVSEDLNPDAVIGSFTENTPCKLVYRLEDPETAEWLAQKSGNKLVDDEIYHTEKNVLLTETVETGGRMMRQMEAYYIDINQLLSLPSGWAVAYGDGIAKLVKVGTYRVEKLAPAVSVHVAQAGQLSMSLQEIIDPATLTPPDALDVPGSSEDAEAKPKRQTRKAASSSSRTTKPKRTRKTSTASEPLEELI